MIDLTVKVSELLAPWAGAARRRPGRVHQPRGARSAARGRAACARAADRAAPRASARSSSPPASSTTSGSGATARSTISCRRSISRATGSTRDGDERADPAGQRDDRPAPQSSRRRRIRTATVEIFRRADTIDVIARPAPIRVPLARATGRSARRIPTADSTGADQARHAPARSSIRLRRCRCSSGESRSRLDTRKRSSIFGPLGSEDIAGCSRNDVEHPSNGRVSTRKYRAIRPIDCRWRRARTASGSPTDWTVKRISQQQGGTICCAG